MKFEDYLESAGYFKEFIEISENRVSNGTEA